VDNKQVHFLFLEYIGLCEWNIRKLHFIGNFKKNAVDMNINAGV
jgi:hypothetical protein